MKRIMWTLLIVALAGSTATANDSTALALMNEAHMSYYYAADGGSATSSTTIISAQYWRASTLLGSVSVHAVSSSLNTEPPFDQIQKSHGTNQVS